MVTHNGFSAWICSAGQRLREYEVVIDSKINKVFCWVPCEIGEQFTVYWEDHGSGIESAGFIVLDGFTVPGQFLYGSGIAQRGAARVAAAVERPFIFSDIEWQGPHSTSKDLGTIILKIKQIRCIDMSHRPNDALTVPPPARGKPGTSLPASIGYGPQQSTEIQHPATWVCEPYDPEHPGSFVTFCFRYRPKSFLINQGIMSDAEMDWETPQELQLRSGVDPYGCSALDEHSRLVDHIKPPVVNMASVSAPTSRQSSYTYPNVLNESVPKSSNNSNSSLLDSTQCLSSGPRRISDSGRNTSRRPPSQVVSSIPQVPDPLSHNYERTYETAEMVPSIRRRNASGGSRRLC